MNATKAIVRNLWLIRLYYFAWLGDAGFILPFISLFYLGRGLKGTEIGLLKTVGAVITLAAAPLWGRWRVSVVHNCQIASSNCNCMEGDSYV